MQSLNTSGRILSAVATAVVLGTATPAPILAQQASDSTRLVEMERRIDALARELERMSLGRDVVIADTAMHGLGAAASKVYRVDRGVSIGGYGEVLYENFSRERQDGLPSGAADRVDALRAVLYFGYKFTDRILFNSEIEIEHANEAFLEFAYIDYKVSENVGVRGGLLLAPLGLVNELHEPAAYLGTERPVTEQVIIPTTWRENGIGLFGGGDALEWRVYMMNALDGAGFSASGLRGGRQKGSKALAEDLAVAGRVDYVGTLGLTVGGAAYTGGATQARQLEGRDVDARATIWDVHADYRVRGWDLRALVAGAHISDAAELNTLNGRDAGSGVAESMLGWYVQGGYDVLRATATTHQLTPYVRYERVDTQKDLAGNDTVSDPGLERSIVSVGAAWKPVPQIVAKLGYQFHDNRADTGFDQWNIQLGWLF